MQLIYILNGEAVGGLSAPQQLQVSGQNTLSGSRVDDSVYGSGVAHVSIAYGAQRALSSGLQDGQQRVLLLHSLLGASVGSLIGSGLLLGVVGNLKLSVSLILCYVSLSLFSFSFISFSLCSGVGLFSMTTVSHLLVNLYQVGHNLIGVEGLPELKVCATLQQLTHTLGLTNTRHFYHDTSLLAFQLLNVGLHYAKLVDTCTHHVKRVVDSGLSLSAQGFLYLAVGALRAHLALHLLCSEYFG